MSEGQISFEELETTATQQAAATPAETPVVPDPAATVETQESKPQFTESDVEAYKQLIDMGITPQNAQEFKAAKQALDNLPLILENNPNLLLDEIEKNNPALHAKLLEHVSDRWFNRLPDDVKNGSGNASGSRTTTSTNTVDPKIASLEAKIDNLIQTRNNEETSKRQETISGNYKGSIQGMLDKLPESSSERDKDYIRLKTNELIWQDPKARERVAQGVYVDVPKYFAEASKRVTAETKAAANSEHERRAGVEARGSRDIAPAAEAVNGTASKPEGHGQDKIWGDISESELKSAYK